MVFIPSFSCYSRYIKQVKSQYQTIYTNFPPRSTPERPKVGFLKFDPKNPRPLAPLQKKSKQTDLLFGPLLFSSSSLSLASRTKRCSVVSPPHPINTDTDTVAPPPARSTPSLSPYPPRRRASPSPGTRSARPLSRTQPSICTSLSYLAVGRSRSIRLSGSILMREGWSWARGA